MKRQGNRTYIFSMKSMDRIGSLVLLALFMTFTLSGELAAQDELPEGVVPPPLSALTEKESEVLEAESNVKKRTIIAIGLMDRRLTSSKSSADDEEFQQSIDLLGSFKALMNATLRDLKDNDYKKNSLRNFKRFEIALREFIPRLELVRRSLPFSHSYHVSELIKSVRETRRKSVDQFYDDTVIPDTLK